MLASWTEKKGGKGKDRGKQGGGNNHDDSDTAVLLAADPKAYTKIKAQRKSFFLLFCDLAQRAVMELYALVKTSLPLRRRMLYFIFRNDGHMLSPDDETKICRRYGLPNLPGMGHDEVPEMDAPA